MRSRRGSMRRNASIAFELTFDRSLKVIDANYLQSAMMLSVTDDDDDDDNDDLPQYALQTEDSAICIGWRNHVVYEQRGFMSERVFFSFSQNLEDLTN